MNALIFLFFLFFSFSLQQNPQLPPDSTSSCRIYEQYSKDIGFANAYCKESIERGGRYPIDTTGSNIWQYDIGPCKNDFQKWAIDREAWPLSDCQTAIQDLCCYNRYRRCNVSIPTPFTNTGRTCRTQCRNAEIACRIVLHGNVKCENNNLYQDGQIDNIPCTGGSASLKIQTFVFFLVLFFTFLVL
eukprot:TRINITY_DN4360_c0_g1_i1.p1 TRINITY_DN4360_c0_g1~~TRINITY_DN4360_c0_g1_i1.p1  ORF type:complete len:211 (-),score=76.14 TRINITY_DN4360_c0_g1_i1:66-626(-)